MRISPACVFALTLTAALCGCQSEPRTIPTMSVQAYEKLPADQRPTLFRDPNPNLGYPYSVHETDGLSRNPDDCARWGCIDSNSR